MDVTSPLDELTRVVEEAHSLHGGIDFLINDAGYCQVGGLEKLTYDSLPHSHARFATNVFGPLNVTRAILPYTRARRSGVIANFSSIGAWRGTPAVGIYAAS
ncbi:3-oxoacyl-[acyl-carrier protein] reductase [Cladophialophora yegresii CBS 114405]|uniref:3-oxoacyl-[acyl-carrier protein] reductase n=1 Tax=Cladophialophora yegresii CBS 114405 TaxID=1182544 RepID=W9X275_9EURO|nr:3-oxoacyl-[acyl-carrier protein] reductase [Cladophialophora yegresii CBS 114405]EXJ64594.1 3-oxoacyl-[acyl-carrier protein] reductase [Cladophialophora yegresii CBS 114405]